MTNETNRLGEHPTLDDARITVDRVIAAVEADDCIGFCVACGAENYGVEPDARKYLCQECGKPKVYGAEDLLIRLA